MRRLATAHSHRGAAGIAAIAALVILQLVVVGMVLTTARDQDSTVQRLDSSRALYAAEAGASMAVRELMAGTDEDGDGGIGTISSDGNAANNPLFVSARVSVDSTVSGTQTTLSSTARANACIRKISALTEAGSGSNVGNRTSMALFARSGSTTPRYSIYSSGSWGANTAFPSSIGGEATHIVARACPTRNELLFLAEDDQQDVNVLTYNGTAWSGVTELWTDTGQSTYRAVDAMYQASGSALIVYWKNAASQFVCRSWDGVSYSAESSLPALTASAVRWATLLSRPGSDDAMLITEFTNGTRQLAACPYTAGVWGAWSTLSSSLNTDTSECYAARFESLSGHAIAVYAESGQAAPRYRTWNGASWSAATALPALSTSASWIMLSASTLSNQVVMAALDANNKLTANAWDGSAWGANVVLESDTGIHASRAADVRFEPNTAHAVAVYREGNKNKPQFRIWNGSSWGSQADVTNINRKPARVELVRGAIDGHLLLACSDDTSDLHLVQWDGAVMSAETQIETSLGATTGPTAPMGEVSAPAVSSKPTIRSWAEVRPN